MVGAIRHGRLDVVEDVYENCVYLPRLAQQNKSTINLEQSITEESLAKLKVWIPDLTHFDRQEKQKLVDILSGRTYDQKRAKCSCGSFCRSFHLLIFFAVSSVVLFVSTLNLIGEKKYTIEHLKKVD